MIIHEIGHNWDDEYDEAGWEALSGWVESAVSPGANFVQSGDGEWWFDNTLEDFVSNYAKNNARDDFAESFTNYFMNLGGLAFSGVVNDISTLPGKLSFMDDFLTDAL